MRLHQYLIYQQGLEEGKRRRRRRRRTGGAKQEMERENKATITEQHRAGVSGSARLYDVM